MDVERIAKAGGWLNAYYDLRAHGVRWQQAAYAAWYSTPKSIRQPATGAELAILLGYKSDQVFYKWQKQAWFTELGIDRLRESVLLRNLADVDERMINQAIELEGAAGVQARRLYYEQLDKARPQAEVEDDLEADWWAAADDDDDIDET